MTIIEDTRQQRGKHDNLEQYFADNGVRVVRSKLVVGDYALPTNQTTVIDTKYGLQEVYGNLVGDHKRFHAECVLAQELGIHLIVLVEESGIFALSNVNKWENPRVTEYNELKAAHQRGKFLSKSLSPSAPVDSKRLQTMMETMSTRYGVEWRFCDRDDTAKTIIDILQNGVEKH